MYKITFRFKDIIKEDISVATTVVSNLPDDIFEYFYEIFTEFSKDKVKLDGFNVDVYEDAYGDVCIDEQDNKIDFIIGE